MLVVGDGHGIPGNGGAAWMCRDRSLVDRQDVH